eukprot:TRINITY_DN2873_c0_g1_i1.p1 TRINITY_DN2873_c0_g1~~TRINITY_DN2873_c0_g1_i1.p1  ORF type:complete len:427 (+),score=134.51 TRINITY_DN2873_c0_g1_i1:91-1371(+)
MSKKTQTMSLTDFLAAGDEAQGTDWANTGAPSKETAAPQPTAAPVPPAPRDEGRAPPPPAPQHRPEEPRYRDTHPRDRFERRSAGAAPRARYVVEPIDMSTIDLPTEPPFRASFVNLTTGVKEEDLSNLLKDLKIEKLELRLNAKGYPWAIVTCEDVASLEDCLHLQGQEFQGRQLVVHLFDERRRHDRDQRVIDRVERDTSVQVRLKKRSQPVNTDERASEYDKGGKNPFGSAKPVDTASAYTRPSPKEEEEVEKEKVAEPVPRHDAEQERKITAEREEREKLEALKEREDDRYHRQREAEKRSHVMRRRHRTHDYDEQRAAKLHGDDGAVIEGEEAAPSSGDHDRFRGRRRDDRRDDRRRGRDDRSRDSRRKGPRSRGGWSQAGGDRKEKKDIERKAPAVSGSSVPEQKVEHANPFFLLDEVSD